MADTQRTVRDPGTPPGPAVIPGGQARRQLLAGLPVTERRLQLAGISTAVLEGGEGPPVVLLHGPMANATHWMRVIPGLAATHRVIVPDLPGHGASEVTDGGPINAGRVLEWLDGLIAKTCGMPPVLVGQTLGGAIALRFAIEKDRRPGALVLVDTFGLRPFRPTPEFGIALSGFLARPTESSHTQLWQHCAFDLEALRHRIGVRWQPFEAYNLDRAREPGVQQAVAALMDPFGATAIATADLARISVPTTLVWGRHDKATPVSVAEQASARLGWPLQVIENCNDDPPVEQPDALLSALRGALAGA